LKIGGYFGDQTLRWKSFLAPSAHGRCSATITISQETSIKVQDAGSQCGEGNLSDFSAVISFPSGSVKNGYREHRIVILPDFQGLGIGVRLSDAMGEIYTSEGKRYFSKTAHPRLGEYREASPKWRPTTHNKQNRGDYESLQANQKKYSKELMMRHQDRVCYAHEYVGNP